jgi:hypothetical protein
LNQPAASLFSLEFFQPESLLGRIIAPVGRFEIAAHPSDARNDYE